MWWNWNLSFNDYLVSVVVILIFNNIGFIFNWVEVFDVFMWLCVWWWRLLFVLKCGVKFGIKICVVLSIFIMYYLLYYVEDSKILVGII